MYELYDIQNDPFCLTNLALHPEFGSISDNMQKALLRELKASGDPRVVGPDEGVFDTYKRYSRMREFPKPDWAQ